MDGPILSGNAGTTEARSTITAAVSDSRTLAGALALRRNRFAERRSGRGGSRLRGRELTG